MIASLQIAVNGKIHRITTESERTLLEVLREDLDLTGTKYGCGAGSCRACTVLLDGKPVQACQTSIDEVDGHSVETIEGLSKPGVLHPVQEAFLQKNAMQCGYCVPGMILSTVGLLRRIPDPTKADIIAGLNGNICRCCGYNNIIRAVQRAAQGLKEVK